MDDVTGALFSFGGCAAFGAMLGCDASFNGIIVSEECPVLCNTCPGECGNDVCEWDETYETCPNDCEPPPGCDLPDSETTGYLQLTVDGSVLFKSIYDIAGFQFTVVGATPTDAYGGVAGDAGFTINANTETNIVLGFSLTGATIPAGCGTLVELDLDGTPTGLTDLVMSDPEGVQLYFEYYENTVTVAGCMDDSACNYNADATEDDGSCTYAEGTCDCDGNWTGYDDCDCFGNVDLGCGCGAAGPSGCDNECGSTLVNDDCGVCDGDNSSCSDCAGTPNGSAVEDNCGTCDSDPSNDCVQDCNGEWDGDAVADACGTCGGSVTDVNDCCEEMDCAGECGGDAVEDDCGVCGGDNSSCSDCAGTPNGDASYDVCGVLCLANTPSADCSNYCDDDPLNDCVQDCVGIWGGSSEYDECGVCNGINNYVPGTCNDCNEIPNGNNVADNCDTCDEDPFNDCTQDCEGEWGGSLVDDECGVCGGDNSTCADCAGTPNGSAVEDNCGTCDSDPSNDCVQDCAGQWGGGLVDDNCGVCGGDGSSCDYDCDFPVCMNIGNVDTDAGTLDIYMNNQPACSYCENWMYNNNSENWYNTGLPNGALVEGYKQLCENQGNSTWIVDVEMTEEECGNVPDIFGQGVPGAGNGGWWFDGYVAGLQFYITGAVITDTYGGTADEAFGILQAAPSPTCHGDGTVDELCNIILGADASGGVIDPSTESQLLMTLEFEDYNGIGICFAATEIESSDDNNWSPPVIGDQYAEPVLVDWGTCDCDSSNVEDCAGECGGSAVEDECGVCGGDSSSCSDCDLPVCMNIGNVDTDAGTLEIYMQNVAGCSYCTDSQYNNKEDCLVYGGAATWEFDPASPDAATCAGSCTNASGTDVSQFQNESPCLIITGYTHEGICSDATINLEIYCIEAGETWWDNEWNPSDINGVWFSGEVGGFQFQLTNIDVTDVSGGSADDNDFIVDFLGVDGTETIPNESGISKIIGFYITATSIPESSTSEILTQITFTDFNETEICFGAYSDCAGQDESAPVNLISDTYSLCVQANWSCACLTPGEVDLGCGCGEGVLNDNDCCTSGLGPNDEAPDCTGVCGGYGVVNTNGDGECCASGVIDCLFECGGNAEEDNCGVCDDDPENDCVQDCNGEWGGSAIEDECGVCDGYGTYVDECGVCDGPGAIYECGCNDFPSSNVITAAPEGYFSDGNAVIAVEFSLTGEIIGEGDEEALAFDSILLTFLDGSQEVVSRPEDWNYDDWRGTEPNHESQKPEWAESNRDWVPWTIFSTFIATYFELFNEDYSPHILGGFLTGAWDYSENIYYTDHYIDYYADFYSFSASGVGMLEIQTGGEFCDCDGNIIDCFGECGGGAGLDQCGVCDYDSSNDCVQDCEGFWGGEAIEDECGVCNGPGIINECGCSCYNMEMLGHLEFGQNISDITGFSQDDREFAVVGLYYDAAAFVDITDPENPVEVGRIDGSTNLWRDMKYWNRHVYIGTEAPDGVKVISVDDPDNPILVNTITDFTDSHNIHIDADGYLYVVGNGDGNNTNDLWIYQLTDHPENPILVGTWNGEYFHDIEVYNNKLYGAAIYSGLFYIVDVSDKTNPTTLVSYNTGGGYISTHDCAVTYDEHYLITADETVGGHIKIWDISDYENINMVSEYMTHPSHSVHNVYIRPGTDLAIISYYVDGTRILDISDPENPVEVGYYDTTEDTGLYDGNWGTYAYLPSGNIISSDRENGLFIFSTPLISNEYEETSDDFSFNQSTEQAFYFVYYGYDIMDEPLVEGEDWIGLFNGNVCVGSQVVGNAITTVPAMGYDGFELTSGYLMEGDIPHYKIYDASEDIVYDGLPSVVYPFSQNGLFHVLYLHGVITQTLDIHGGANLVSFYVLPEDAALTNVLSPLAGNITSVITEGSAANYIDPLGWIGSLEEFSLSDGYWLIMESDAILEVSGHSLTDNQYTLHLGPNLISFPLPGSFDISVSIPDDVEPLFEAILSEGAAAMNTENGWLGALTYFEGGSGYWVIVSDDVVFSYENPEFDGTARAEIRRYVETRPSGSAFTVAQSPNQAFYFVGEITLDEGIIEDGDWLLSYNGNVLTGIRQWQGVMIDIPAMGLSDSKETAGYLEVGDIPSFKLLQQMTGEIIPLGGEIPAWSENGLFQLNQLSQMQPVPDEFMLKNAYPNPFNPVTTLDFGIPIDGNVSIEIYNLQGRLLETLTDRHMEAGYYSVIWNADSHASGMYFVKMIAGEYVNTQKLMLVK